MSALPGVFEIEPADRGLVVDVLCEAFFDYPVMRYVLGERPSYAGDLARLVQFFVGARVLRRETLLGVPGDRGRLSGAAIVSHPGRRESPPGLDALREETWEAIGPEARSRYEAFGDACAPFAVDEPHLHLNMIGVRASGRGRGIGRLLLDHVHRMSAEDDESIGVSLTTETESNVPLYRHFGYELLGRRDVDAELTTWGFLRRNE